MAVNDTVVQRATGVADGNSFTVDASGTGTGAAQITEFASDGSADIKREIDLDGDSTYEISIQVDSLGSPFHSQGNQLRISTANNSRLVLTNTSGSGSDFYAQGFEVDD